MVGGIRDNITSKILNKKLNIIDVCNLIKKLIMRKLLFHLVLIKNCNL
jgi:hypothetical protein